ncbi:MAG TPA: hypothetical protein VGC15_11005 [Acetobacteraceae bacterium]
MAGGGVQANRSGTAATLGAATVAGAGVARFKRSAVWGATVTPPAVV